MDEEAVVKRILPHSPEAEQSVIGSMLMDKDAAITASELLRSEDFYQKQYGIIFETMVKMIDEGRPIDLITLQDQLKGKNLPPEMMGIEYFRALLDNVAISANVRQYAEIVRQKAILRRLIKATEGIANECYASKEELSVILENTEKQIFHILQDRAGNDFISISDIVIQTLEAIETAAKNQGSVTGIPTGFLDLDYKMSGLQKADLILVAARPSMGKTAFVLNIAEHVVLRENVPTIIFSLEMSKDQLVKRMLAMNSKVDSQKIRNGELEDEDWTLLAHSAQEIGSSCLMIDDTPAISITELRSKCRKYKLEYNLGLVIIDYLQLMTGGGGRTESRQQEISEISRSLKALAREINAPVIALSQLSRAVEQRPDKRPMLSDLRESGAIEQDADVVMFIYRDEYYNHDSDDMGTAEIIIGKQRNGPTGTIKLAWQSQFTKFQNLMQNRQ